MRPRTRPRFFLGLCLVPACQSSQADTSQFTTMPALTSSSASAESTSTSTGSSSGSGSDASSLGVELSTSSTSTGDAGGTTVIFDVGSDQDVGGKPLGCKGKIDFLFVISRYAGMEYFQTQLLDAFPKFIDTIQAKFPDFDYQIMVVDGDAQWGVDSCDLKCPVQCVPNYPCDYMPTTCDTTMGAGVMFSAGDDAPNEPCKFDGASRYMVKGQSNLKATFACAAQVGSSGAAAIGEALTEAVQPAINAPGGCNEGFIRDDALLMVTLISNTYDTEGGAICSQQGTPDTWMAAVRAAKQDDLESVVVFSILRAYPECHEEDRTCQMVKMFPYHLLADRDELDYSPFFEQATDLVGKACTEFIPG